MDRLGPKPGALSVEAAKLRTGLEVPLSAGQRRMWFWQQYAPGTALYNISVGLRLQGSLDTSALERALRGLFQRHEVLRSRWDSPEHVPTQHAVPVGDWRMCRLSVEEFPAPQQAEQLELLARAEAARPFDLGNEHGMRATLVTLSADEHRLLWCFHHGVCDGWSIGVLLDELCELYLTETAGVAASSREPSAQYASYASSEEDLLSSGVRDRELAYWRGHLAGAPVLLDMPTDRPRPVEQRFHGASLPFALDGATIAGVRSLASRNRCTPFMALIAAWQTLLHRYSRQATVISGTVIANRGADFKRVVGYFANTVAMRTDFRRDLTVGQLLRQVRANVLSAHEHGRLPFEEVVEALEIPREPGRMPLLQTMIAMEPPIASERRLGAVRLTEFTLPTVVARFELSLIAREMGDAIEGCVEYDTDLFDEDTVSRLIGHLHILLREMSRAASEDKLSELSWMETQERRLLLQDWNATDRPFPARTVHQLFEAQVRLTPEAVALVSDAQSLTYRQLNRRANRLARHLREWGIGVGEMVPLMMRRSAELIIAELAVLKCGAAYVPLDEAWPNERRKFIVRDCRARLVLSAKKASATEIDGTPSHDIDRILDQGSSLSDEDDDNNQAVEIDAGAVAYAMYTSGSTGEPKGVLVPHRAIVRLVVNNGYAAFGSDDRVAFAANAAFDVSTAEVWAPLLNGGRVVVIDQETLLQPERFSAALRAHAIDVLFTTVAIFNQYAGSLANEWARLRYLVIGGDALDAKTIAAALKNGRPRHLINAYGPTEATTLATTYEIGEIADEDQNVPIGRPIANTRIYILDEHRYPVPIGVRGEIYIGGAGVACGYLNRPELTAERFIADPFSQNPDARIYRTGDVGRWRADGNIEFLGRNDHQVKIRGYRIELGEIELQLLKHPTVREAAVVARQQQGEPGERHLVAYYTVAGGETRESSTAQLRRYLEAQLPPYMVPTAFVRLERLPLTPNGKVDRKALPAPQHETYARGAYEAPCGVVEEAIAAIWEEVLKVQPVGRNGDFFALGGHSLLATQVASRIRRALGVELSLRTLFEARTIAALAAHIDAGRTEGRVGALPPIDAAPRERPLPLSFSQRRMWFMQQLEPSSTAYNMPFAIRIRGELDTRALAGAIEAMVARHEAFRTTFSIRDGEPVQTIHASVPAELRQIDLSQRGTREAAEEAAQLFRAESMQPFDLALGPLHRLLLARLGPSDHMLLWLIHHAIGDLWSMAVLMREFQQLYRALRCGEMAALAPLPIQYSDFAVWQRRHMSGEALASQLAYWRGRLDGIAPLALPADRPRPRHQTFRGSNIIAAIPTSLLTALKEFGARHGVTPFMTLLACFKILLARYCNQEDIAIGVPIANRTRVETESLVGTLVNTLVMQTSLTGNPRFTELLARVQETALGAYAHQDLPFEVIVEELAGARDAGHAPLVQVMFNVANALQERPQLDGLALDPFLFDSGAAQFDLSVLVDTELTGSIIFTYSTEMFDAVTIRRMVTHYLGILEQAISAPEERILSYPMLTAAERAAAIEGWNRTTAAYPAEKRACDLIDEQARRTPQRIAVRMGSQSLTYAALEIRANQLGGYLQDLGIGPGKAVGVCLERSPDMIVALLAIMKAGGAYVPLDPAFPAARLQAMSEDADLSLSLTQDGLAHLLPRSSGERICLDEITRALAMRSAHSLASQGSSGDLAYVLYTSGSTGKPKGVEVSHRALTNFLCSMLERPGCRTDEVLLAVTTLSFDIAGLELYLPLIVGGQVELASREEAADPRKLMGRMQASRPTLMQATPATWRMLIDAGWGGDRALTALCGGEPLVRDLAEALLGRCAAVWNLYGPTETTIWSTCERVQTGTSDISIGRPIANTRVYVLDSGLQPVPIGVSGEIYIGGHGVARGYRNRPDLTADRFIADPFVPGERVYRTGDLARYLPDGRVLHLGRLDQQVKIRGFRIELGEVEHALVRLASIRQAVVVAKTDVGAAKQLVAYLVPRGEPPAVEDMRARLLETLPAYMVPSRFVFLEALPLTPNNKIDVTALPVLGAEAASMSAAAVQPRNPHELQLTALWRQVLQDDSIGIHDNFFEVGGHSLKAVELFAQIEHVYGVKLPLAVLFQSPTIEKIAPMLVSGVEVTCRSLIAIQPLGDGVPLFAFPGVGGEVLVFATLAQRLGRNQPFYGLRAQGLYGRERPFTSVEAAVAHYLVEIRSVRPVGPYFLAGACTGGVFAYEAAQQLAAQGHQVSLVIMDSWHPSSYRARRAMLPLWPAYFLGSKLAAYSRQAYGLPARQWPGYVQRKLRGAAAALRQTRKEPLGTTEFLSQRVVQATLQAVSSYRARPYAGGLLNVIAAGRQVAPGTRDTRRAWEELAAGPIRTEITAAEDSGRLFVSPHVDALAQAVMQYAGREFSDSAAEEAASPPALTDSVCVGC